MSVNDFAKYVIDNMHRATLVNALKVSDKLISCVYDVNEFINCSLSYVSDLFSCGKIDKEKSCRLSVAFFNCKKDYNSPHNYSKNMILNNLIMSVWEICCRG